MNLHTGSRARAATLIFAAALASVTASSGVAAVGADSAGCVYYETPYKQELPVIGSDGEPHCMPAVEAAAIEAQHWPNFDSTALGDRLEMVKAAGEEAAAWPDFDPSDMTQEIAQYEAQQEAAAWPDFDPSDMTQEIAEYEAQQEAAGWPNYDSTAIDTSSSTASTANSPRMMQIAAEQDSGVAVHPQSGNAF